MNANVLTRILGRRERTPVLPPKEEEVTFKATDKRVPKGCCVFTFGKVEIVALNKKNAQRKYDAWCKERGIDNMPKSKTF